MWFLSSCRAGRRGGCGEERKEGPLSHVICLEQPVPGLERNPGGEVFMKQVKTD